MKNWENEVILFSSEGIETGAVWSRGDNLARITDDFAGLVSGFDFDAAAAVETKGIILAAPLAARLSVPLLVFRKRGKIRHTGAKTAVFFRNWRGEEDGIEIETDLIGGNRRILIVDDLADTLVTLKTAASILEKAGNVVTAFLCFANLSERDELDGKPLLSLLKRPVRE